MTTVTLTLTPTNPSTVKLAGSLILPGMPAERSVIVNGGDGSTPGIIDVLQPDSEPPTSQVTWTLVPGTGWGKDTQVAALVFGFCGIAASAVPAHQIFQPPADNAPIRRDKKNTWALPAGTAGSTGFTYMTAPTQSAKTSPKSFSWSLTVVWAQVKATGLLRNPTDSKNTRRYLCAKFRCYFYTPSFGLWYVDPEFDLCPK